MDNFATKMKVGLVWTSKSCQEAEFLEGYERGTETSASNFDTGASDVGNAHCQCFDFNPCFSIMKFFHEENNLSRKFSLACPVSPI